MLRNELARILRSVADRLDSGTCSMTRDEAIRVISLLADLDDNNNSDTTVRDRMLEAYGILSDRVADVEDKVSTLTGEKPNLRIVSRNDDNKSD